MGKKASGNGERRPLLAVDVVIRRTDGSIVFVKRKNPPFKGFYALPGGFVEYEEKVEDAAIREVREETGIGFARCLFLSWERSSRTRGEHSLLGGGGRWKV